MIAFMKNLALMGAMLMIVSSGSGPGSLDAKSGAPQSDRANA